MFGLFKRDPTKKLTKQIDRLQTASVQVQRSGNLRKYAEMVAEISQLEEQLATLRQAEQSRLRASRASATDRAWLRLAPQVRTGCRAPLGSSRAPARRAAHARLARHAPCGRRWARIVPALQPAATAGTPSSSTARGCAVGTPRLHPGGRPDRRWTA